MSTFHFSLNTALKSLRETEVEYVKTKTHSNTLKKYNLTDDQVVATDESGSDSDGGSSSSSFSSLGANDNCHQESHQPQEEGGEVVILALLAFEAALFDVYHVFALSSSFTRHCSFLKQCSTQGDLLWPRPFLSLQSPSASSGNVFM